VRDGIVKQSIVGNGQDVEEAKWDVDKVLEEVEAVGIVVHWLPHSDRKMIRM
jgi:hypothetical protein